MNAAIPSQPTNGELSFLPSTLNTAATTRIRIRYRRRVSARILAVSMAIVIDRRFRGPKDSGNGGYSCGLFAGGREAEVTLRLPPPLETPLRDEDGAILAGEALVAEVRAGRVDLEPPAPLSWADAVAAQSPDL